MSSKRYFLIPALLAIFCSGALGEERRSLPVSDLETDEDGTPILRVTLHPLHGKGSPRSCRFALDTGTTMTILDTSIPAAFFWDEHTFTEGTDVSGRPFEVPVVLIKRMEVAGMLRDGVPAVRMDLKGGMLGRMQDVPVDGVLGMSSLKETRFVLDQKQRRLEWWGRRSKGGVALPIAYGQAKLPLVMLRIHEREAACVLDTGMADGIGLPASFRPPGRQGQPATLHGLSGLVSAGEILVIPRVEAPPGAWLEVPDHFQETQKIGYIGLEIWSAAPVCFDFISNLAILEPGPGGGLPVQRGADHRLPLCWDRSGPVPRLRVLLVKPGGPLEEAKAGDEIVQVGPLKGKSLNRRNIQEWTAKRKAQVWTVLRDGRPLNIQVPPRSSSP